MSRGGHSLGEAALATRLRAGAAALWGCWREAAPNHPCGAGPRGGQMLYADKRALETNLQVSLLKIREKELQFYTQNCIAIGT